ncbi:MAG: multicopper oxidase domain-containing protein, partial [Boseongicola sp.]|nr:multicopper oxidase domain-containing protein [Boseongicola sp.]
HYFNRQMQTATEGEMSGEDRRMWGKMRMNPRDISDVTGETYTFLINGHGPADNLEFMFKPGEKVRLRIINGSAMTFFNVRIPGVPMEVIQADGQDVQDVAVDELQIGVAETYDVVVSPPDGSHALVAEAMDRSGMGVASLTAHPGHKASPPPLREPVTLTMADMGMGAMDHGGEGMDHSMRDKSLVPPDVEVGPGVDMIAPMPVDRMDFPGLGLDTVEHRVLRYTDLKSKKMNPHRMPERTMQIHLTGNMERYMWSFDGKKFTSVTDDPIRFAFNERVRVKLVNDTMMAHPIHLHGHFFELVNGGEHNMHQPRKHTLVVQPGSSATFDLTADEPGDWAFHCHLLYHMHAGMMQVVTVRPFPENS